MKASVAEGEYASIIYQGTPQLKGGGGWALSERKDCVGEETWEGDGFVFIHQRVSGALKDAFPQKHLCVINEDFISKMNM